MDMTAHNTDPSDGVAVAGGSDVELKPQPGFQTASQSGEVAGHTTASGLIIRSIEPGDHDAWRTLFRAHGRFYKHDIDDVTIATAWDWITDLDEPVYGQVATTPDGTIVGIVHYQTMHRTMRGRMTCYLGDLFVDPLYRGMGAGRALIERVIAAAKDAGWRDVRWLTEEHNYAARMLYDSFAPKTDFILYQVVVDE